MIDFPDTCGLRGRSNCGEVGEIVEALAFEFRYLDLLFNNGLLQFTPLCLSTRAVSVNTL
jgi:hypothetical protein